MPETFEQFVARVKASAYIPSNGEWTMARQVKMKSGKDFTFKQATGGGESKYPWNEWLNGDLLLIEQSHGEKDNKGNVVTVSQKKDYEVDTNSMPGKLKSAARRKYKVVQISRLDADGHRLKDSLIIRARDMNEDERQAEDLLRAEEKVRNAERRKAGGAAGEDEALTQGDDAEAPAA